MEFIVDRFQILPDQLRVNLRGRNIAVPQHFLNGLEIRTVFQKVCGKAMAQCVGVLYGREELLEKMPPYQGGGEMIKDVTFERTTYNELPFKFEAGTPSVGDVLGLQAAIDFMHDTGIENISKHEKRLTDYATERLMDIEGLRIYGTAPQKTSVISFLLGTAHPYDTGTLLDKLGIAVRTGHHCTQPIMDRYGIPGTVRASFAVYNTIEEINILIAALKRIAPILNFEL